MTGPNLYTSNRLELLLDKLSGQYTAYPSENPFTPEIVLVQSPGMARWLSLQIADKLGICANFIFEFPNTFIDNTFKSTLPDFPGPNAPNAEANIWSIYRIIKDNRPENEFGAVRNYLKDDKDGLKAFQLATQLAGLFDQYNIYRPDMIINWDSAAPDSWQAIIWRELMKVSGTGHRAGMFKRLFDMIQSGSLPSGGLPEKLSLFGVSYLPPLYIDFFKALANIIKIDFYVLNPCREYWADILSEKEASRYTSTSEEEGITREDLHITTGNSLLASMGKQGREFLNLTADFPSDQFFQQPGEDTLLHSIQSDILNLHNRGAEDIPKADISPDDHSVQVHSCHNEMREIEILHDQLLRMLDSDSSLLPRDIIVMAPDIERYTPYIQAVFGNPENLKHRIPFTIADRGLKSESNIIDTLFKIIDLTNGRFGLSEILSVLESDTVLDKFKLSIRDIEIISGWLDQVKVRWGVDSDHKRALDLPGDEQNTWRFGLKRLLLGYAMPGENNLLYNDILPYDNIEGEQAVTLGNFLEFIDKLFDYTQKFGQDKTFDEWADCLNSLCEDMFSDNNDNEYEFQSIQRKINNLYTVSEYTSFDSSVNYKIIRQYLDDQLKKHSSASGFIAGSVTFCAMLPMRSIPFNVICMIGMNNTAFPRQEKHYSFDLISNKPRPGDRSLRQTDRYLFLEALLSARERLYISYTGQGITDNNTIPPAVTVSELLDYIHEGYLVSGVPADRQIKTSHRLQAFSSEYFEPQTNLHSYSTENYLAAKSLLENKNDRPEFFTGMLPALDDSEKTIELAGLIRFFGHPARYLLNNRLGIYIEQYESTTEDEEPYSLSGLNRYLLASDLLECRLNNGDIRRRLQISRADGVLPHGAIGDIMFENIYEGIAPVVSEIEKYARDKYRQSPEFVIEVGDYKLTGVLDNIYKAGLVNYKPWSLSAKDRIGAWLQLLISCVSNKPEFPKNAILIGTDRTIKLSTPNEPEKYLRQLISLYDEGMRKPLSFFPKSSYKYVERLKKTNKVEQAIKAAAGAWYSSEYNRGEGDDPYYKLCFRRLNFADSEFHEIAQAVFSPIFDITEAVS